MKFDPNMTVGMPPNGVLECRIDGYLAKSCVDVTLKFSAYNYAVEIKMPSTFSITSGVPCLMMISSRNADRSATLKEGLYWQKAGLFEITIESINSANDTIEYSKKTIEVYPQELTNFWVWSASKMRSKTTAVTDTDKECSYLFTDGNTENQCGLTFIRASFQFPNDLAASNSANKPIIIVEFARTNLPNYVSGFTNDLGTGLSHRDKIPCYVSGIPGSVVCKLYYGTWPNPTRVKITEFDLIHKNTNIEIHIPKIFNPNTTLELVAISVRAQETVSGKTNPLFQAQYTLVNTTYEYPTNDYSEVALLTLDSPDYDVTFDISTIDTSSKINIKFISTDYDLQPTDVVAWEIPTGWQLNSVCTHEFSSIASTCKSYISCNWVVLNINTIVVLNEVQTGKISMTSPPFTYISAAIAGKVKAYIYSHSKLIYILTYPTFSQSMSAETIVSTSITTTDAFTNEVGEYSITATIPKNIPGNGAIRITILSGVTPQETNCRNDVIAGSQLNDLGFECVLSTVVVATITYPCYVITLGDYELVATEQILIKANFLNPSSAQATTWTIETFYLYETPLNLLMCEAKNVAGPAIVAPSTGSIVTYWDNQHRTQNRLHVNDIGSVQILVTFTNALAHNTVANTVSSWYVIVKMSSADFTLHAGSQVHATWNMDEAYFTTISIAGGFNSIKIYAPQNVDVAAGKAIYLNLTSLNAYDGKNGFNYPTSQGIYLFTVSLYGQSNALKETGTVNLFVPGIDFTLYSSSTLIINAGYNTLFTIKFQPQTAVYPSGYIIFYLPTTVEFTNEAVYDNDLGSGLNDGDPIACVSISGFVGTLSCVLSHGNQNSGKEASIQISGFTAILATSTLYVFQIQQIKNPVEITATDTKEVYTRLESYDNTNVLINSGICYDFTIATLAPPTDLTSSPTLDAPFATSYIAGATGVKFTINLQFPYNLAFNNQNDYFVIEFPKPIFPTISSTTYCTKPSCTSGTAACTLASCTFASAYNWVIYKPKTFNDNIDASQINRLELNNGNQALYSDSNGIFLKGYVITKRILRAVYYFKKLLNDITTNSITITMSAKTPDIDITLIPISTTIKYLISITVPSSTGANDVPAGGLIDIEFPAGFVLESFCQNDVSSAMTAAVPGDITCVNTPDATKHTNAYYTIGGYQKISTTSVINVLAYATTPGAEASSLTFSIYIYADTARAQQMYTSSSSFPSVQSFTGFKQLKIPDEGRTPYVIRKGGQSFFQFQLIPAITFNFMRLSFSTASAVSLEANSRPICYFSDYEASYCKSTVVAGASLALNIKQPSTPAIFVASKTYTMTIDATCGTKNGLIFGAAGKFEAKVEFSEDGSTFSQSMTFKFIVLSANDFTSASMIMLWANKATSSPLIVKLKPANPIPADGKIVVTFPTMNNLRVNLFKPTLGYTSQKYNGDTIDCYSASSNMVATNGEIICKLFYSSENPYIEVSGFNQIAESIEFLIPNIDIPDISSDEGYADLKLHTEDSSGTILNERVIFDVVSAQTFTSSTATALTATITTSEIIFNNIPIKNTMSASSGGRIVFVFPSIYYFDNSIAISSASIAGGTLYAFKNILIYTPSVIVGGTSISLSLGFSGINSILLTYLTNTVKYYVIYNRIYVGSHTATLGTLVPNADFSTFNLMISNLFTSTYSDFQFSFQPSVSTLPAKSKIKITFSAAWSIDRIQVISGLTGPFKYGSATTNSIYIILSNAYALINGNIVIRLTTQNPSAAATYTVTLAVYADFAETLLIQKSSDQSITLVALPTATLSQNCFAKIIGSTLTVTVTPNAATILDTGFDVRIYGLSGLNTATGNINGDILTVTLDATGNYYKMSTVSALSTTNTFVIDDILGADTRNVAYSYVVLILAKGTTTYYEACPTSSALYATVATATSQFTTSLVDYGHYGTIYYNYFAFTVSASMALSYSSTNGFYLSFSNGFAQDLGYVLNSNDYVPCYISGHTNLKCVLSSRTSNYNGETKIYLQNFNTISSGSEITIWFYRVKNPSSAGTHSIRLAYYSNPDHLYDQIIAYVDQTVITAVSIVSETSTAITPTPNTYQSLVTSTITLHMNNKVDSGDKVLFFVHNSNSYRSYISPATAPTPTITVVTPSVDQLTCVWHDKGQMIFCFVTDTISNYDVIITNYENPMHYIEGKAFLGIACSNNVIVEYMSFTNSFTKNVFSQVVMKGLDATNLANSRFYFEMTPSSSIPKGGCIEITFSNGFTAPNLNNFDLIEGTYQGTITAYFISNKLYLKGFDYIYGGYILKFIATINGGASSGSASIIIASYATSPENIVAYPYVIDQKTGLTLTLSSNVLAISAWAPSRYIVGYSKKAISSQSFINLKFMPNQDMTTANLANFLMIQLKDGTSDIYTIPITLSPLRCRFNLVGSGYSLTKSYSSQRCFISTDKKYIVVEPPATTTISAANYYELMIFFAETDIQSGFQTSGTNSNYKMGVYILSTEATPSSSNIKEFNIANFKNILAQSVSGCVKSFISNNGNKNLLHFDIQIANPISDYLEILFPLTRIYTSTLSDTLYTQTLGSTLTTLSNFYCNFGSTFATTTVCSIWYGQTGTETRPTRITISGFGSLAANTVHSFDIANIVNPATISLFTYVVFYSYSLATTTFAKQFKDFFYFPFVTYSTTKATATQTATFPSPSVLTIDSPMTLTLPVLSTQVTLTSLEEIDGFLLTYDTNFYDPLNTPPSGTIAGSVMTSYFMTKGSNLVILDSGTLTLDKHIDFTNLKNPPTSGTYTSAIWQISVIVNKLIYSQINYGATASPNFIAGSFAITTTPQQAIRVATTLATSLSFNSQYTLQFDFQINFVWDVNTALGITFPTGFTVTASATFTSGYTGTYSVTKTGTAVIIYNNNLAVSSATWLKVLLIATTPASGTVGVFKYDVYTDYPALTKLKATLTSATGLLTLISQTGLNLMEIKGLTVWKAAQQDDYGPVEFNYKPDLTLAKAVDYIEFVATTPLWTTIITNIVDYDDLKCFWGKLAALSCYPVINGFRMYTPASTAIIGNQNYVIYIGSNRAMTNLLLGQENYKYGASKTYIIDLTPYQTAVAKTKVTNSFIVSPPDFTRSFINTFITTKSQKSIFLVSLTPTIIINSNTGSNPGQILIEFPTMNSGGATLFDNVLGTGYNNGELLDCICTGCPAGLQCKINAGANSATSPSYIIIDATSDFANSNFIIRFPKLTMPTTDKLFIQMRIVSRKYDAGVWTVQNELIHVDNFYTTTKAYGTQDTGLTQPAFDPNLVGQPGTISFDLTQNAGSLAIGSVDRFILESTTDEMVFELPPLNYRGLNYQLSVLDAAVTLYPKSKWIEVIPATAMNSQMTLTFNDMKNMPYLINAEGIVFNVYVWISGDLVQIYNFQKTDQAVVNCFTDMTYDPIVAIIRQPNTYKFIFQPYNRIPKNGKLVLTLPDCADCDFQFFDSYCLVEGAIQDASCDIIPGSPIQMVVKGLSKLYDPFNDDGPISISFYAQNPSKDTAPGLKYFTLKSYFVDDNDAFLMDFETQFDAKSTKYVVQGGFIITVDVSDLVQIPEVLCPGGKGPLILYFQFSGDLTYPDGDYIDIEFYTTFKYTPVAPADELICYFKDMADDKIQYIKTFRCDFTSITVLRAYVPEEISPLLATKKYELTIYTRTGGGLDAAPPSGIFWAVVTTSITKDSAWTELKIPACPFDGAAANFDVISFSSESSLNAASNPTWTGLNITLKTQETPIPTGDLSQSAHSRFLFEFYTNNELDNSFDSNLGIITTGTSNEVGCAGQYLGKVNPLSPAGANYIYCTAIQANGNVDNSTPAYVMFNYYEPIPKATIFNLQITKIANPEKIGSFSHIKIRVQSMQQDGSYYDIYQHTIFHLVGSYLAAPGTGAGQSSYTTITGATLTPDDKYVVKAMGNETFIITSLPFILSVNDIVVWEFSDPYNLPTNTQCFQVDAPECWIGCAANYYSKWFTFAVAKETLKNKEFKTVEMAHFKNPDYEFKIATGNPNSPFKPNSPFNVYIYQKGNLTAWYKENQSPDQENIHMILQTSDSKNDINAVVTYSLGIILGSPTKSLKYLRILASKDFQSINNCMIKRGLVLVDMSIPEDPIKCEITIRATDYLIEVYNFGTYNGDGWLMLSLDIKNPLTEGWTQPWSVITYASQPPSADLTMVQDNSSSAEAITWVGARPYPNLFRVYRNTKSYDDRKAELGDHAEMDIRLIPKTTLPSTTGSNSAWVEIWMPNNFDIPNGGTTICQMGQNYHSDITGQYCQITSDRKIVMYTNNAEGLGSPCNLMTMTTTGAVGGDGIKLSDTPSTDSFQLYEYINSNLIEYSVPDITTQPEVLTVFSYVSTIKENYTVDIDTVYRVSFQSNTKIPAGYDTTPNIADTSLKNPIGYLTYEFNSQDLWVYGHPGYKNSLGLLTTNLPCRPMQGLIPPTGEKIKCTITPVATADYPGYLSPILVTVSNFEEVSSGTTVEVHFLECKTPISILNDGHITIGGYQVNADGTKNQIIKKTIILLVFTGADITIPGSNIYYTNYFTITPSNNYVGSYSVMDFTMTLPKDMIAKANFVFKFPVQFELKYQADADIQAAMNGILLTTIIYAVDDINEIYFEVPAGKTISSSSQTLRISRIRNMAYEVVADYKITMIVIDDLRIRMLHKVYQNCPKPKAGPYSSKLMVLSSYFSGDVNVLYTFSVTPTYRVPSGSTITVTFPNYAVFPNIGLNYLKLPDSIPTPICTITPSAYLNPAVVSANSIVITTSADIPENTVIKILLSGVKNPIYEGPTNDDDYYIDITNSLGYKINKEGFLSFVFLSQKSVNVLYMNIDATSLYKAVSCDYIFALQTSSTVPAGGQIFLKFPTEWASQTLSDGYSINGLSGSFTSSVLTYSQSYSVADSLLTINPNFNWPAKKTLYITMNGLINPGDVDTTTVFQAYTEYDGVKLDQTDATDLGLTLTFSDYHPNMNLIGTPVIYPTNEAEIATYSFNLNNSVEVVSGSQIELQFSSNYDTILSTYDKGITCYSALLGTIACTVNNGKIIIPITANIPAFSLIDLQIKGIMNPNVDSAGSFDVILRDGSSILSYTNKAADFQTTSAPKWLNLTFLNTTSTNLQQKSNYTFCVQTDQIIPLKSSILIGFPLQFSLRQKSYTCKIASGHNATTYPLVNGVETPECTVDNQLRTVNITGQITGYDGLDGLKNLCYEIDGIENPSDSGESGNFVVSIYDLDNFKILYDTYGVLSYPTTLTYSRQGLRIIVGSISTLYVGTMSVDISVTLERAVSYEIYLTPSSDGFEFLPPVISFFSYLPKKQSFMIRPLSNATLGQNKISWTKVENVESDQFSEVADSFFVLAQNPSKNQLKMTISPIISRTSLRGTSLPIKVTLSAAAAENMTVFYCSYKPNQTDYIVFDPKNLTFQIGETSKTLTYHTYIGAVSGQIQFWLDSVFASKYTMNTNIINFEILDIDNLPPKLLNYYIVDMDRTYMYFRISTSESGWVRYMLTLKGTQPPPNDEIQNPSLRIERSTKTDVMELYGSNSSYQAPVTKTYIYYDMYLYFSGLEEQTEYILYFVVEDLSENAVSTSVAFPFRTSSIKKKIIKRCKYNF